MLPTGSMITSTVTKAVAKSVRSSVMAGMGRVRREGDFNVRAPATTAAQQARLLAKSSNRIPFSQPGS